MYANRTVETATMWYLTPGFDLATVEALVADARTAAGPRRWRLVMHPQTLDAIASTVPARRSGMTVTRSYVETLLRARIETSPDYADGVVTADLR